MYGVILESICCYGQEEYGETEWEKVMDTVGLKNAVFSTHLTYPDDLVSKIAEACAQVFGIGEAADYMIFFGRCFVSYWSKYEEYEKMLRCSGRHFCQFLREVDNIHSRMRFSYPRMRSPSMIVTSCNRDGVVLQYRSKRKGLTHYLIGQLLQVANNFYEMPLEVTCISEGIEDTTTCVNLRLDFDNRTFLDEIDHAHLDFGRKPLPSTTLAKLLTFFPFGLVLDEKLTVKLAGQRLLYIMGTEILDCHFGKHFRVRRPNIDIQWKIIEMYENVVWEVDALLKTTSSSEEMPNEHSLLDTKISPFLFHTIEKEVSGSFLQAHGTRDRRKSYRSEWVDKNRRVPVKDNRKELLLKGQMYILKEHHLVIFLSMPLLSDIKDMEQMGLFLNDLSMHDLSREMVLQGWQHGSSLEIMYDSAEANSNKLEESLQLLEQWKNKGDELLYSMIPKPVAEHLRKGDDCISTCQSFEKVSVLFAEATHIEEQTNMSALDLVRSVNNTYSLMDNITEMYQVFKVETTGGVYMVVGGAPEPIPDHLEQIAALALHMIKAVASAKPCTHNLRIGINVGPVVAGVVGIKLPRYCLFGDTVNTSARMQTHAQYGTVQITEKCADELRKLGYQTNYRGKFNIKGKGEMNTYILIDIGKDTTKYNTMEKSFTSLTI